jgi:predicted flavoprotein YhiN
MAHGARRRFARRRCLPIAACQGPAILQISSYWQRGVPLGINFLPDLAQGWLVEAKKANPKAALRRVLGAHLPDRLAVALAERLNLPGDLGNQSDKALRAARPNGRLAFQPRWQRSYAKAEVTAGGIATTGLSQRRWRPAPSPVFTPLARRWM